MSGYEDKLLKLEEQIVGKRSVLIAFSGGIDSTLLAIIAKRVLGSDHLCVLVNSPLVPKEDVKRALEIAKEYGLNLKVVEHDPLSIPAVKQNAEDRCYHCKKGICRILKEIANEHNIETIMDGTNMSDLGEYRPGTKATSEEGVVHPFIDAGIAKDDIRQIAKDIDLAIWDLPSSACLASRIPYNETIELSMLKIIDEGEAFLHDLDFKRCRLRLHNAGEMGRIEVPEDGFEKLILERDAIVQRLKGLGVQYVALDLNGYQSGSFDKTRGSQIFNG
ncbi:ATP-dependent sacrificial sulfur transferase LarE [Methanococcoides methylutens]|uniref:ATP-utilizing enzymes of the PP-loop superfamily n=1 Tax=Methanococcoides methylutens MM1 TaxID=1434104 RepID=A0A0E3SR25_METMT|nr:ATP-dependent sacrificial sulfur transferase LarE [Methanococcoides methylutens]AKB85251.1 ATP-utilizing enzymes of the PP-loop superfamily [Methanococcoides methylutens MM1]